MYDAKAVVINSNVFVGGGSTIKGEEHTVLKYNSRNNEWEILPLCPVSCFGLIGFRNLPVVVGGLIDGQMFSNKLYQYDENTWKEPSIPPMITARHSLTAIGYQDNIITCGGKIQRRATGDISDIVEVYTSTSNSWFLSYKLPFLAFSMTSTIIGNKLYLLGGYDDFISTNKCIYANIDSLVTSSCTGSSPWMKLPNITQLRSTAASMGGCLMAIGGQTKLGSAKVCMYFKRNWVALTELLKNDSCIVPAVAQLETGEILILGGANSKFEPQVSVYKCHISYS